MKKEKVFYYHFDKINPWFMFNAALLIMLTYVSVKCSCLLFLVANASFMGRRDFFMVGLGV